MYKILRFASFAIALALLATSADAVEIWLSDVGTIGGGVAVGNQDETFLDVDLGAVDQQLNVWIRPDPGQTIESISLSLISTNSAVIDFMGVTTYNPLLGNTGSPLNLDIRRYEFTLAGATSIDPDAVDSFGGTSILNQGPVGAGIGPQTTGVDPLYDAAADAWLLATATYDVARLGTTDLYLQIGSVGINPLGGSSSDIEVVFGGGSDPSLNGNADREMNSATRDGSIAVLPTASNGVIQLNSYGQTHVEDFDGLGAVGNPLPTGWTANTGGLPSTTVTQALPTANVAVGIYNAGSGSDRTLAAGNTDSSAPNGLHLWAELSGSTDVYAVVLETRVEAWFGDPVANNPGEAAFAASLEFDAEKDGTFSTATTFNGGIPITTGLILAPGTLDGNGAAGTAFTSDLVVLPSPIPAGSDIRLTFDAQGAGQTSGYIFGLDNVLLRIVAAGDTDGNGDVNSSDLFAILGAGKFNNPAAGAATWGEGDFNGDTLVDSTDLFAMLAASQFNQGPYSSAPAATAVVPEPATFAPAAVGLVALLALAWRRRRARPAFAPL